MTFKSIRILLTVFCLICSGVQLHAAENTASDKNNTFEQFLPETGTTYSFQSSVSRKHSWQMKIPGVRKPVLRNDSLLLNTAGLIRRKKADSPENIELVYDIGIMNGVVNGLKIDDAALSGQKALIKMTPGKTTVSMPDLNKNTDAALSDFQQSLLSDSSPQLPKGKSSKIPPEELLAGLFPYPADKLDDYIPNWQSLKENESVKIIPTAVIKKLRDKGFIFKDNQLTGTAKRGKPTQFRGIWVFPIQLEMTSENIPGYDFQFSMTLFFPEKNPTLPLRIQRKFLEITDRILPSDNPWYSGNAIQVVRSEEINMTFLPWQK